MKPTSDILRRIQCNSMQHHDGIYTRLYRYLLREDIYFAAYRKLYKNKGAATKGIDDDTADGFGSEYVSAIIDELILLLPFRLSGNRLITAARLRAAITLILSLKFLAFCQTLRLIPLILPLSWLTLLCLNNPLILLTLTVGVEKTLLLSKNCRNSTLSTRLLLLKVLWSLNREHYFLVSLSPALTPICPAI